MAYEYEQELTQSDDSWFYVPIPKDWKGIESEKKVRVIVNGICIIVPEGIANATGELLVLRFLEAMIDGKIIDYGDVQKALEHLL
jgi:hypothetical protein